MEEKDSFELTYEESNFLKNEYPGDVNPYHIKPILNTIGCFFGLTLVFGVLNASGALEPLLHSELSLERIQREIHEKYDIDIGTKEISTVNISWIFSLNLFFLLGAGILGGCKIDRSGTKELTLFGGVLAIISFFGFSKCGSSYTINDNMSSYKISGMEYLHVKEAKLVNFIITYGIFGISQGLLMTCCFSSVSKWYSRLLATYSAIISFGGSLGGILFPIMIRRTYSSLGFENSMLIYSGIITFLSIACFVLMNDNFDKEEQENRNDGFKDLLRVYMKETINLKYFLDHKFLIISIGLSCGEVGTSIIATYLTSYCLKKGYTQKESYNFITVMNCFGIVGRSYGFIADRYIGSFQMIIMCMFAASLSTFIFLMALGKHHYGMYLYCIIYGSSISGFLSLCPTALNKIWQGNDFGKRFSTMYLFAAISTFPIIEIGGLIIGNQKSSIRYQYFWLFSSFILLVGAICYGYLRMRVKGFKMIKY
ncbi:uncharacterized protein HGUI_00157 [Hanseniaspora guilliermondii]|uniref:Major facilitator superfamily (MFS) profile domain-containing protein n=1 Tax=Hanseniaspora guilliermondii TaxID=56406 RepID=A0A1L0CGV6_9ASCO|nr:uncharacterized protein HGUI_00157 [Hanseniaspora guilliermondii]